MLLIAVETVEAVSLYWGETPAHTTKLRDCLSFANEVWNLNFQNIRLSRDEVTGEAEEPLPRPLTSAQIRSRQWLWWPAMTLVRVPQRDELCDEIT